MDKSSEDSPIYRVGKLLKVRGETTLQITQSVGEHFKDSFTMNSPNTAGLQTKMVYELLKNEKRGMEMLEIGPFGKKKIDKECWSSRQ